MQQSSKFSALLLLNPLFAEVGAGAVEKLSNLGVKRTLKPSEVLFLKGDEADALYAIRRGQIRIEVGLEGGQRLTLNILGSGDVFGEIGLLDGSQRSADARAANDVELFMLRRKDFLDFLDREPSIARRVIEFLCQRIRWVSDRMEEAVFFALPTRIARRLLALVIDFGSEVNITQEELANYVGAARETVSRQLQDWRRDGVIELGRGKIKILNSRKLMALSRAAMS
jgi:CRP/FNR family cyclic AMP-dependent transcriptional regulator